MGFNLAFKGLSMFEFSLQKFKKKIQISHLMKIDLVGTELFNMDGRTDGQISVS